MREIIALFQSEARPPCRMFAVLVQPRELWALFYAQPNGMGFHMAEMPRPFELKRKAGQRMTGEFEIQRFGMIIIHLPIIGRGDVELFRRRPARTGDAALHITDLLCQSRGELYGGEKYQRPAGQR